MKENNKHLCSIWWRSIEYYTLMPIDRLNCILKVITTEGMTDILMSLSTDICEADQRLLISNIYSLCMEWHPIFAFITDMLTLGTNFFDL